MNKSWFHFASWLCCGLGLLGLFLIEPKQSSVYAQSPGTDTPTPGGLTPFITNVFEGEPAINVRTGPSTIFYPTPCGSLPFGATAPALGTSPAHEWILIVYKDCPKGVGWIYAPNVKLSPGFLPIVEPPPTQTPLATATIDSTLAAAFNIQPTETRLPTFTPAPPLIIPTYEDPIQPATGFPVGGAILVIALVGFLVLGVSFFTRR
jgi:hypothetical protein